jgi:tight adherence protein C
MSNWILFSLLVINLLLLRRVLKQRKRKSRICLGLPDALDLLVVCIEGGLSPVGSLARVSENLRHPYPELSDELYVASHEMRTGYSLEEALSLVGERTGVDDIKELASALSHGGPLEAVRILHTYSTSFRHQRQQRAAKQAIKAAIKIVPALLVFVVPPLLVVTLGPAVVQWYRALVR